jgi:hypothetical protein
LIVWVQELFVACCFVPGCKEEGKLEGFSLLQLLEMGVVLEKEVSWVSGNLVVREVVVEVAGEHLLIVRSGLVDMASSKEGQSIAYA